MAPINQKWRIDFYAKNAKSIFIRSEDFLLVKQILDYSLEIDF
ncbi:hypothetical protein [Enterococcus faecalis]|nr:hypothetical protein [Enterococcus faecalis]